MGIPELVKGRAAVEVAIAGEVGVLAVDGLQRKYNCVGRKEIKSRWLLTAWEFLGHQTDQHPEQAEYILA